MFRVVRRLLGLFRAARSRDDERPSPLDRRLKDEIDEAVTRSTGSRGPY